MKNIWNKYLKDTLLLYCGLYTLATIINSIAYLAQGIYEDPSGNWHELDRAIITFIVALAYVLIRHLKIKNYLLKAVAVYVPTMLLTFGYVWFRGLSTELASSAYRDIFINFTAGFVIAGIIAFVVKIILNKRKNK